MTETYRKDLDLKPLFNKLGHSLEEIRVRALENIISKLEHRLVCEADLVQEKHLLIRLLEWFNFPECPKQKDVLSLLHRLSQHSSGAGLMADIGAVEFLTQLRPNIDAGLQRIIDSILDQMFHLPSMDNPHHAPDCIYKQHHHYDCSAELSGNTSDLSHHAVSSALAPSVFDSTVMTEPPGGQGLHHPLPPPEPQIGYFGQIQEENNPTQYAPQTVMASCFKFSTFPWAALTPTDRHVLSSTDTSLRSRDPSLVISACEFLSDVVLQDFPAEVFLQRPTIIKSLLSLVSVDEAEIGQQVAVHAVRTLRDLAECLQTRIRYYQDPVFYTPKQDFLGSPRMSTSAGSSVFSQSLASTDTRPSLIGHDNTRHQGDGQDGENSTLTSGSQGTPASQMFGAGVMGGGIPDDTDVEDMQSLQFLQWTLPQFCATALERVTPAIKTHDERLVLHQMELLQLLATLLKEAILPGTLWDDHSLPARELVEKLHEGMESLGDALYHHYHGNLGSSTPQREQRQHRVAYLGVASFISQLLTTVVPIDKVGTALPESMGGVLSLLCGDESMSYTQPLIRSSLLPYLEALDPAEHATYNHARHIASSMKATCQFLMDWPSQSDEKLLELVSLVECALDSLPYHLHLQLVEGAVQLASFVNQKTSPNPVAVSKCGQIMLTLLAHPQDEVRGHAYHITADTVKDALGVNHVTEPASTASKCMLFVLNQDILYEICCFGMTDSHKLVQTSSQEILLCLLQSQLLVPTTRWQQLIGLVTAVMPVLQAYAGMETSLGKCLLGLLDAKSGPQTGSLPQLEKLRGTLRLMFSPILRLRAEALGHLAYYLAHEESSLYKQPLFSELDVTNLANLFLVDSPRVLQDEDTGRSVFQEEALKKVYDIFESDSMDGSVRKSAASQLAIMLQDKGLHSLYKQYGGVDVTLALLRQGIRKPETLDQQNEIFPLLPHLVKILRYLIQHDFSLRHQMAHQAEIYYTLVRCALLFSQSEDERREAAMLLVFLLFDEVAMIEVRSDESSSDPVNLSDPSAFSLPLFITKRYKLPLKCATHHSSSPHQVAPPPQYDPLAHGVMAELLRLAWNTAWQGSTEDLVKFCQAQDNKHDQNRFSSKLHLSMVDRMLVTTSVVSHALQQCVYNVQNATNHTMVTQAVVRIKSYLIVARYDGASQHLHNIKWQETIARFFRVIPSSSADDQLLGEILLMLTVLLQTDPHPPRDLLTWMSQEIHSPQGALMGLINRSDLKNEELPEPASHIRRQINHHLLKFLRVFIARIPYSLVKTRSDGLESVKGELSHAVLNRLNMADAAHFYNLASLEGTLLALMHITARPGWSTGCESTDSLTLCLQMLHNLLQVVSAFHIGRGGMCMSYMGRGVTRCATLCLRHLAYEMATQLQSKDWPRNWLFSRQATAESVGESGFHWLTPLWAYRDTEVRVAGVGIAVALTTAEAGRITMTTQCQHITGGIWGAAFSVLLDQAECSLVREQATLLLVNLTSQPMPTGNVENSANVWQGPVVRNEDTRVSLLGLPALLALLHHSNFYHEMSVLLANYYPQPAIHPVSVASGTSPAASTVSSQTTFTTAGSGSPTPTSTPLSQLPQGSLNPTNTSTPLSQLPQGSDLLSSNSDVTEGTMQDYQSVATPCLVSGVCQLLSNLVTMAPQDTLYSINTEGIPKVLIGMLDSAMLEAYVTELQTTLHRAQYLHAFRNLLRVHISIVDLMTMCTRQNTTVRTQILADKTALKQLVMMLSITYQVDVDTSTLCEKMWQSVMTLLMTLLQIGGHETLLEVTPVLTRHWNVVVGRCVSILQDPGHQESPLWMTSLHLLSILLSTEGKLQYEVAQGRFKVDCTISHMLNMVTTPDGQSDLFSGSSGAGLCQALIKAFDSVVHRINEQAYPLKLAVINALKCLLGVSTAAKATALQDGMMESLCEQIRRLHVALNMEALHTPKALPHNKKKDHAVINELILILDLLRNFMYQNQEIKLAAYESGLSGLLHKLWSWVQIESSLMFSVLPLLATYVAKCPQASSSLASTSAVAIGDRPITRAPASSNSLVHCLIKLAQKEAPQGNIAVLKATFSILASLTLSQECRGVLWKSNFVHEFSQLSPGKTKKSRTQSALEGLWLALLLNLSFSTDGQNMILKINDAVSLLLEYAVDGVQHHQTQALLILRNLSFHAPNKPKLLANDKYLPVLIQGVQDESEKMAEIASSAIYALVYNSHKAKVNLKSSNRIHKLEDSYNSLLNMSSSTPSVKRCAQNLHDALCLLRE